MNANHGHRAATRSQRRDEAEATLRALDIADCVTEICLWSRQPVQADQLTLYCGHLIGFCKSGCHDKVDSFPRRFEAAYASRRDAGLSALKGRSSESSARQ